MCSRDVSNFMIILVVGSVLIRQGPSETDRSNRWYQLYQQLLPLYVPQLFQRTWYRPCGCSQPWRGMWRAWRAWCGKVGSATGCRPPPNLPQVVPGAGLPHLSTSPAPENHKRLVGWSGIVDANLDGRLVRVVDLNDRRVAWVQRELHTDQRLEKMLLMRKIHHKWSSLARILRYLKKIWFQTQNFEFSPVLQCCLTQ